MARKNRRISKESERFIPSKELQELLFGNKNNNNFKARDSKNNYKSNPNYKKIS